jgi:hypothetical protein
MALYYGDVFHKGQSIDDSQLASASIDDSLEGKGFTYKAGFYFKASIEK